MIRYILFLNIILFSINAFSQLSIFTLHPSVGNEVDKFEKNKYYLFPEINDSIFIEAVFFQLNDSTFVNRFFLINDSINEEELSVSEIEILKGFISKLDQYYNYQNSKDSLLRIKLDSINNMGISNNQAVDMLEKYQNLKTTKKEIRSLDNQNPYTTKEQERRNIEDYLQSKARKIQEQQNFQKMIENQYINNHPQFFKPYR